MRLPMQSSTQACCRPVPELALAARPLESSAPAASDASVVNDEAGHVSILLTVRLETH
jgi:hypothetical protein